MRKISDEEMYYDYDLWLYVNGYIDDNIYARHEYEDWLAENGIRD